MSIADGFVIGTTKILDHGPDSERYTIALLGDGFMASEQTAFNDACAKLVEALANQPWFGTLISAINVYRISVISNESGADDPLECAGTGAVRATYFDARYCDQNIPRLLSVNAETVFSTVKASVAGGVDYPLVLVNSPIYGGGGYAVAINGDWTDTALHEMGHAMFGLADEYDYYKGCGEETDHDSYPYGALISDLSSPNVTIVTDPEKVKWRRHFSAGIPIPRTHNDDCSKCDRRENTHGELVGLFEGAGNYHCGVYRPVFTCKMREVEQPFCRVCMEAIFDTLRGYYGQPALASAARTLQLGTVAEGAAEQRTLEIGNVGAVDLTGLALSVDNPAYVATLRGGSTDLVEGDFALVDVSLNGTTVGPQGGLLRIESSEGAALSVSLQGEVVASAGAGGVAPP